MKNETPSVQGDCVAYALFVCATVGVLISLSACSFHVGTEWHGRTGIDNRTQTELVEAPPEGSRRESRNGKY